MKFRVLGTGSYVPPNSVSNEDLSKFVETSDEWITKRVGIKSRNLSVNDSTEDMAFYAAQKALEESGVDAKDLGMIILATISSNYATPSVACMVQNRLGASCPSFDIGAACSGFVFGLQMAAAQLALNPDMKILILGAERLSSIVDWTDRNTCIIFADGAGAMVVDGNADNMLSCEIHSYGENEVLCAPSVTGTSPYYKGDKVDLTTIKMNGKETYKFAVNAMARDIQSVMEKANVTDEDIKLVIPHQANIRIINEAAKRTSISPEKFCSNIEKTGNTSAASVAILLDEVNKAGKLQKGDKVVISAFGAGLCSAACVLVW